MPQERDRVLEPSLSPDGKQVAIRRLGETAKGLVMEGRLLDLASGPGLHAPRGTGRESGGLVTGRALSPRGED